MWRGVELGVAFAWTCLTCLHQGVLLAVLLVGATATLWRHWRRARLWLALACAALVAVAGTAPLVLPMQSRLNEHQFLRPRALVEQLSARPGDYTAAPGNSLIDIQSKFARPHWWLSPGWIKWGLAFAGGLWGLSRRRWRWWSAFLMLTATLAFVLSLGPHLNLGSWTPYWTFADFVPGLDRVRNVFRFAFFVQMAVVLLAAEALHAVGAYARVWNRRVASRTLRRVVMPLFALGLALEVLPAEVTLGKAPDATAYRGWVAYVREHASPGRAVACLPMAQGNDAGDFDLTARWMYLATFHGAPLVNGYSGFFPQSDFNLRDVVNASFPSEESLEWLEMSGTELVVVMRSPDGIGPVPAGQYGRYGLELAYSDLAGVDVYRLTR
jgi:hypothetical protein